jgi:ABC-type multidrug transport system fused ATPase/permease subunit
MRFYPLQEGQILVDGVDIKKYNLLNYRRRIGLVSQEPTLFLGNIKDNIIFNSTVKS